MTAKPSAVVVALMDATRVCEDESAAEPRLKLLYDLPLLLLPAVAQPLAALLPYGCGTPLAGAALPIL